MFWLTLYQELAKPTKWMLLDLIDQILMKVVIILQLFFKRGSVMGNGYNKQGWVIN